MTVATGMLAVAASAEAGDFVLAGRVQAGATFVRSPAGSSNDLFVAVSPELSYFFQAGRVQGNLRYGFAASLNSFLPNSFSNRLTCAMAVDASERTRLLFGVEALQASIGNYLLVRPTGDTQVGGIPQLNTQLGTLTATEGVQHELSAVTRLTQTFSASWVSSLDPDVKANNYLFAGALAWDRSFVLDAVGVELGAQYAKTIFPPLRADIVTAQLGPRWSHDVNRWLTTSVTAQAAVALSPDPGTEAQVTPAGRASAGLTDGEGSGLEASYTLGYQPNLITGTLLQSHQGQLRGFVPLSRRDNLLLGVSLGLLHAKNVDLRARGANDSAFDAVLHDVDLTWGPMDYVAFQVRYQFVGQTSGDGAAATPAIVRHAALVSIGYTGQRSRAEREKVPTKFPQRVDQKDRTGAGASARADRP
jgi:hypothetical protein